VGNFWGLPPKPPGILRFGACRLWRQLQLDGFWQKYLPEGKGQIPRTKVLELLVVNRLIDPGSEFRVHLLTHNASRPMTSDARGRLPRPANSSWASLLSLGTRAWPAA
jgi:hypothetical protein